MRIGFGELPLLLRSLSREPADLADRLHERFLQLGAPRLDARLFRTALPLALLERRDLAVGRLEFLAQGLIGFGARLHALLKLENLLLHRLALRRGPLHGRLEAERLVADLLELRLVGRLALRLAAGTARELRQLALLVRLVQRVVLARLLRVAGERLELRLDLLHDVLHAQEVGLCVRELLHRLALAVAELRDARRLLEEGAAVLRTAVEDVLHAVLADDAHAVVADARVGKELVDILEAAAGAVDEVLALPAAVEPARHRHLAEVHGQRAVVVENQRDLRDVQRTPLRRAREDDVLRARAAQVADVLLAEHPAHGIRDIALAAAVRADNRRDAVVEFNGNLVGKGLESICLKAF